MISASYGMEHRTGERITGLTALEKEISSLKEERDAVILAHNYQVPAVQDIADFVGDSLELARAAAALDCAVIVFCGVDFMAETAAILSPDKTVLLLQLMPAAPWRRW